MNDIDIEVGAPIEATPGQPATIRVRARHHAARELAFAVSVVGLDPSWGATSQRSLAVGPVVDVDVELAFTPPPATPAGRYPFVVAVVPLDPVRGLPAGAEVHHDAVVVVGDTAELVVTLAPGEPRGVLGRRINVELDNRGTSAVDVGLAARTSHGLRMRLRSAASRLGPGERAKVRARLRVERPKMFGQVRRIPFVLTAQGHTTPLRVDGVFVARPMFGRVATRVLAVVVVLALWGTAAVVAVSKLSDHVHKDHEVAQQVRTVTSSAAALGGASSSPGSTGGKGGSGGNGGSGGSGGNGGSGGSGGNGGSTGSGGAQAVSASTTLARVNGTVTGSSPGGVTVTMAPTSLVDEAAQGATFVGVSAPSGPVGKLSAALVAYTKPVSLASTTLSTTTQTDGSWAFAGVRTPGYYLLTFSKPGYETKRYVISPTPGADPNPLKVPLVAGDGHLSGAVSGPDGPLGGASVTITDGTVTIATTTPTSGQIGSWSVDGISTPGTYLVSVSANGYATASTMEKLPAGGSLDGVNLTLQPGVESLVGTVSATDDADDLAGIGGVTVSVTNGTVTRTATTVTTGPVGHYTLPNLPVPSTYTVTISGDGFATRTAQVKLLGDAPDYTLDSTLSPSTATVTGIIQGKDSGGSAAGLVGAGVVLTGNGVTYKTTTVSSPAGGFAITGVVPGTYVLTAEKFGQLTSYATVVVGTGVSVTVPTITLDFTGGGVTALMHVQGRVTDSQGGTPVCPSNVLPADCVVTAKTTEHNGSSTQSFVTTAAFGDEYVLPPTTGDGLEPGLHAITVSAPGYEPVTITVQVPLFSQALGDKIEAPPVALMPAATITGTITSVAGAVPAGTCVIAVPQAEAGTTPPACTPDPAPALTCKTAISDAGCAVADTNGVYSIGNLATGTYAVFVEPTDTQYIYVSAVQISVQSGDAKTYNATLNRYGKIQITVMKPDSSGSPVVDTSGTATVKVTPGSFPTATADTSGTATISNVPGGTYTITVTEGSDSATLNASVGLNQTYTANAVLTSQIGLIRGRVVTLSGSNQPVASASVTLTGVTGYIGTVPIKSAAVVTTDASGCFAFGSSAGITTDDGQGGPCDGAGITVASLPLVTPNVDADVAATGFSDSVQTGLAVSSGNLLKVSITPPGTKVSGTVATDPASGVDLSKVSIQATSKPPGSGSLSFNVDSAGAITWTDTAEGSVANVVYPGEYKLRASLSGYDDATVTVDASLTLDGSATTFSLTLSQFGSLTISSVDSSSNPVPDAVFILTGTGIDAKDLSPAPGGSSVTFTNLSPSITDYKVSVQAAGYVFADSGTLTVSPGVTTSDSVTLTPDGSIGGTISGSAAGQTYPLVGVTVTATSPDGKTTLSDVTKTGGKYNITGTTSYQGLDPGDWTVSVSASGYNGDVALTQVVTVTASTKSTQDLTLTADNVKFTVTVQSDDSPAKAITTATVTLTAGTTLSPDTSGGGDYTFNAIAPTKYSLSVVATGYSPLSQFVTLTPGDTLQTLVVTLAKRTNTVFGTVQGQKGTAAAAALEGATAQAYNKSGVKIGTAQTTDADGYYEIDGLPDGKTTIKITDDGYATASTIISLNNGQSSAYSPTLNFYSHQVTVTVTSESGESMTGAQVSLDADPLSTGVSQGPQTVSSGQTIFNQVLAGDYTISVTGPAGHLDTTNDPTTQDLTLSGTDGNDVSKTVTVNEMLVKLTVGGTPADPGGNATITFDPAPASCTPTCTVAADGNEHDLFVAPGDYDITASASGYVDGQKSVAQPGSGSLAVTATFDLQQFGSMSMTVEDADGNKVDGATVDVKKGTTIVGTGKTGSDGTVTISDLPPDTYEVDVDATAEGDGTKSVTNQTVTAGTETKLGVVNMPATKGSITVTVKDIDGNLVDGATVDIKQSGTTVKSGTTSSGVATISDLPAGTYDVAVDATAEDDGTGSASGISVTAGDDSPVEVDVPSADGWMTVTVTDDAGDPVSGASVTLSGTGSPSGITDSSGVAKIKGITPGTYTVDIDAGADGAATVTGKTVSAGGDRSFGVQLKQGTLTVTVSDSSGVVSGATVSLSGGPTTPGDQTTNSSGVATFSNLPPGTYTINVDAGTTGTGSGSGTLPASGAGKNVPITVGTGP